uniref:Uncharacterized protein n=1 Tax=Tanacetum cinerariifolium TaxID=118510 RepID=A0A6L2NSY9_TANCI|nr:hypothetical protein [Tanacetum cinerariifolium]
MHALVEWKLYDSCGVHHVTSKDKVIFMLVEKDYPLRKGLALVMISYKLQVENYSQMVNDLILKIYNIANSLRQQVIEFPLAEELPTTSEESCHCQKKSKATAVKIALLSKVKKKLWFLGCDTGLDSSRGWKTIEQCEPVALPSPDYVPGPEHPPSPDYVPGPEHPPSPVEIPYVSEPEYPEYLVPSDAEAPLVRANSPKPKLRHIYAASSLMDTAYWFSEQMELYIMNRQHGRMILEFDENGPHIWSIIDENGVTRPRKYSELTPAEAIQADCDVKATHIILKGLPPEVYALSQQYPTNQSSTPLLITYTFNDYQSSFHHNVYSLPQSIPQLKYPSTVNLQPQQAEFPQLDSVLTVSVFKQGDDSIDAINHMMSFLSVVITSRYPTTNN